MIKKPKIRIPVALNQHAGKHKDKKKELKKYACRKSRRSFIMGLTLFKITFYGFTGCVRHAGAGT